MEIADALQTKEQLCTAYTRYCLTEKIRWGSSKNYGGGHEHDNGGVHCFARCVAKKWCSLDEVIASHLYGNCFYDKPLLGDRAINIC